MRSVKEAFYFSHDYGARNDEKIVKMISKEGWASYGIFWAIIEKLYEADGWLEKDYDCIAFDLRTDSGLIKRVVENYKLFVVSIEKFHSNSVLARLRARKGKSEMARQSAKQRWDKPKSDDANALRTQSEGNAIKESKGKEKKVKEITSTNVEEQAVEVYGNQDINWVLETFKEVMGFDSGGRKQQDRFMAKHLLKNYNKEQIRGMLRYCATNEFAPRIGSVEKLWHKRGDIVAGILSLKNKANTNVLII